MYKVRASVMRTDQWRDLTVAVIAILLVALATFFIAPGPASERGIWTASIAAAFCILIIVAAKLARPVMAWVGIAIISFFAFSLKQWASKNRRITTRDTVWNWLTDQILVAQGRYAFSVSCIAFMLDSSGTIRCLLLRRKFERFGDTEIWMWPGGRFRGSSGSIEKELRDLVRSETGCNVDLLPGTATLVRGGGFSEPIETYNRETGRSDLENELIGSPLVVMQQNRSQRYEVPGHIDLIYLARVRDGQTTYGDATLLALNDLDMISESQLWRDTKECIRRASKEFLNACSAELNEGRSATENR